MHPEDDRAVLSLAAWGLPHPSKIDCRGKYYVAWAESHHGRERVSFRLMECGEAYVGHYHGRNICWVRMYVTVEKEKDPDCPSEHVVMSTRMA